MFYSKHVSALVLGCGCASLFFATAHAASLNAGERLTLDTGVYGGAFTSGSFFAVDFNGDSRISADEQTSLSQGTLEIVIGLGSPPGRRGPCRTGGLDLGMMLAGLGMVGIAAAKRRTQGAAQRDLP